MDMDRVEGITGGVLRKAITIKYVTSGRVMAMRCFLML
jgi:hypothetical protein